MVYIDIPYVAENNRIDKRLVKSELDVLRISEHAKRNALEAIYNFRPRGIDFKGNEAIEAILIEVVLKKLGIPYRRINEPAPHFVEENA